MIIVTYTNCAFLATISLFLTSSLVINRYQCIEVLLIAIIAILMAGLSITRLFFITTAGQGLASEMRKCVYTLKRSQIDTPCSDKTKKEKLDSIYQLLKDNSHSPITPISSFSLSTTAWSLSTVALALSIIC